VRFLLGVVASAFLIAVIAYVSDWVQRWQIKQRIENRASTVELCTLVAIAATAIFSLVSDWIFYSQLEEMKASRRPWVSAIQALVTSDTPDQRNDHFEFPIVILFKNTGQSLATQLHAYVYASAGIGNDLVFASNEVCKRVPEDTPTVDQPYLSGLTLAPGQTKNFIANNLESRDISLENYQTHRFWLHGCVKYRDEFKLHHTRFCFVGRYIGPEIADENRSLGACGGGEEAD
jgi:hypothetical protein